MSAAAAAFPKLKPTAAGFALTGRLAPGGATKSVHHYDYKDERCRFTIALAMRKAATINAIHPATIRNGLRPNPSRAPKRHIMRGQTDAAVIVARASQGDMNRDAREMLMKMKGMIKSPSAIPALIACQTGGLGAVLK